jgi:signal transduction histidine kinase
MSQLLQVSISKKIELSYELAPERAGIEGDPAQVQQVVMNLILNAAEAIGKCGPDHPADRVGAPRGGPPAAGSGLEALPAGEYVRLIVADTGSGMDQATLARIFEPFFTTKFTGRGLGLAAVQGIMRSHRGALTVTSVPAQGTTFSVYFPA